MAKIECVAKNTMKRVVNSSKKQMTFPWAVFLVVVMTIAYAYHCETGDKLSGFFIYFCAVVGCLCVWSIDTKNYYYVKYLKSKES